MTITDDLNGLLGDYLPGPRVLPRLPEGWEERPYTRFSVQPLAPTIGAVIEGVSLADPVDTELFEELNRALLEWKVLIFPAQAITGPDHAGCAAPWAPAH